MVEAPRTCSSAFPKATFCHQDAIALLVPYFVPALRQRASLMHLLEISQIRRWLAFLAGINKPSALVVERSEVDASHLGAERRSVEIKSNACKRHGVRKSFARS
jgi:hypothetical protein